MDSQVKPWCSRDTNVPRSQYTRQNSNDYQSDVDVQGYTGFSLVSWQAKDVPSSLLDHLSESYNQCIPETSWIACVLLGRLSSSYQRGWSPPWGPGPVNVRLLAGVSEGLIYLHFLIRWSAADTLDSTAHMLVCSPTFSHKLSAGSLPTCCPSAKEDLHSFPPFSHRRGLNKLLTIIFLACASKNLYSSMAMILSCGLCHHISVIPVKP